MQKFIIAGLLIAAAVAGFFLQQQSGQQTAPVPEAQTGPQAAAVQHVAFTLPDLEGQPRSLSEWDGKARLINFWATWCAPCRDEIPLLKETQTKHAADNLQIIGVAVDFRDDVVRYANDADFNYPILIGQHGAMAIAESVGVNIPGLPFTLIVSPDGELIKTHVGEIVAADMDEIVNVLERLRSGELDLAGARQALGPI